MVVPRLFNSHLLTLDKFPCFMLLGSSWKIKFLCACTDFLCVLTTILLPDVGFIFLCVLLNLFDLLFSCIFKFVRYHGHGLFVERRLS